MRIQSLGLASRRVKEGVVSAWIGLAQPAGVIGIENWFCLTTITTCRKRAVGARVGPPALPTLVCAADRDEFDAL